jgi:hypothetical protein
MKIAKEYGRCCRTEGGNTSSSEKETPGDV